MYYLRNLFLLASFLFILNGCKSENNVIDNASLIEDEASLTFLTSTWPPDAIPYLAQRMGFFEENGVNVKIIRTHGYEDVFNNLESGNLDIWTATFPEAVKYIFEKGEHQIVFTQDISVGADALATFDDKNIRSISDLKGKKVAVESGTVSEFFFQVLLSRAGLEIADLEVVDIPSLEIFDKLKAGNVDAGFCYEPCPTKTLNSGGSLVVDSSNHRGLIVDVYVANKEHLESNQELYISAFTAIAQAQAYFNENPKESMEIMKEVLNVPSEEIISYFEGIDIPTFSDNQAAFDRSSGPNSLYNLANLAGKYLEYRDLIEVGFDTDPIINPILIDAIQ